MTPASAVTGSRELRVALAAARTAGAVLEQYFLHGDELQGEELEFADKGAGNLVSAADQHAEDLIIRQLREAFPEYSIFCEERRHVGGASRHRWVVDPLDGTSNFRLGIPHFSVSIGLLCETLPILGVIYNPVSRQLAWAERGRGMIARGYRRQAAGPSAAAGLTVALDVAYGSATLGSQVMSSLAPQVRRVLTTWSPALDYVSLAVGSLDAIVCLGAESEDKIAGLAIVLESGCQLRGLNEDFTTCEFRFGELSEVMPWFVIARSQAVLQEVTTLLASQRGPRRS